MERKPCRAQLQPPDPTQKNRSSARWNGFFCTPHSQSQLPIACNVAGIRVARTNRHAPAPPEIKLHLTKQSQAPTSLPQGGVFGQLIRPIVHAMRSGQLGLIYRSVGTTEPTESMREAAKSSSHLLRCQIKTTPPTDLSKSYPNYPHAVPCRGTEPRFR